MGGDQMGGAHAVLCQQLGGKACGAAAGVAQSSSPPRPSAALSPPLASVAPVEDRSDRVEQHSGGDGGLLVDVATAQGEQLL
jgi:hypothetical protein